MFRFQSFLNVMFPKLCRFDSGYEVACSIGVAEIIEFFFPIKEPHMYFGEDFKFVIKITTFKTCKDI